MVCAAQQGQTGQGADDDGVQEDFEDAVQSLLAGDGLRGGGVSHGSGTQTSFVGEDTTLHAPGDNHEHGADCTTGNTCGGKCASKDVTEDSRQGTSGEDNHSQAGHDVNHSHAGDQLLGNGTQTLDAAEQNECSCHSQDQADDQVDGGQSSEVRVESQDNSIDGRDDVAGLDGVAGTQCSQSSEDGEQDSQPLPLGAQTLGDGVHGTADPVAHSVALTELNSQQDLGILGSHTDQCGDPQPEQSAGAAQGDSCGDTSDVAGADGACQGGGNGLEGGHLTFCSFLLGEDLTQGVLHGVAEAAELHTTHADGHQDAGADQQNHHNGAPDESVDRAVNAYD